MHSPHSFVKRINAVPLLEFVLVRTSLGPYKFVLGRDSLNHQRLILTPGQEANGYNLV